MDALKNHLRSLSIHPSHVQGFVFFAAHFLASIVGFELYTSPAVIYPATGVALAGLVLCGISYWPVIFLSTFLAYLVNGVGPLIVLGMPIIHTIQAIVGAVILKKLSFGGQFDKARDMFAFMFVALLTSVIIPTLGFGLRALNAYFFSGSMPTVTWEQWWVGKLMSIIIITPLLIRWISRPHFTRTPKQFAEIISVFLFLIVIGFLLFWTTFNKIGSISLIYVFLIPLMWTALRLGPRFMTLAIFITAILSFGGTFYGAHTPPPEELGNRLFQLEIFLSVIAALFFIIVTVEEERKNINKKLETYVDRLEDVVDQISSEAEAKSDFLAILAHELRNPLAAIVSSLELIRAQNFSPEETPTLVQTMSRHGRRMSRLLDDLLDITRISKHKLTVQKKVRSMQSLIRNSLETVAPLYESRNHTLSVDTPDDPVPVHVDPVRIEQVMVNLLTNAAKYTDPKGNIELKMTRMDNTVRVTITDNGQGIGEEMLPYVFDAFVQGKGGSESQSGLGIGLYLSRQLVELHGGTIAVKSKGVGQGSEFSIELPLASEANIQEATAAQEAEEKPAGASSTRHTILIVDDNKDAAYALAKIFELKEHFVYTAHDGKSALELFNEKRPHVVLLDIGLPDMSGHDVAREMRSRQGGTTLLVALTGYGQPEDKRQSEQSGFDHHLTKPVSIADIERLL